MRRVGTVVLGAAVAAAVSLVPAGAAPGDLDPTFGSDGIVVLDVGVDSKVEDVAMQPDGKAVLAGYVSLGGTDFDFLVSRLNPDGSYDPTFGSSGGYVATSFGFGVDSANAVAIQPDGKIVVAGSARSADGLRSNGAVARYNPDSSLDTSFGSEGLVVLDVGVDSDVLDMVVQSDGTIVLAGFVGLGGFNRDFHVSRLQPDGSYDSSFDTDGHLATSFGMRADVANAVAVQPDGKILLAGFAKEGLQENGALVRYNPDGTLDTGFDGDGMVTLDVGVDTRVNDVAFDRDGDIVLGGYVVAGGNLDFHVSRLNPDGSYDTAFGNDGHLATSLSNGDDEAAAVLLQRDGKVVLAGRAKANFAASRHNPDGSSDPTFSFDGKLTVALSSSQNLATAAVIDADGSLFLAGHAFGGTHYSSAAVRLVGQTTRCQGRLVTVDLAIGGRPSRGDDVILGTPGDDAIDGLGGNDLICAGAGADVVSGGRGGDAVLGGRGDDEPTAARATMS